MKGILEAAAPSFHPELPFSVDSCNVTGNFFVHENDDDSDAGTDADFDVDHDDQLISDLGYQEISPNDTIFGDGLLIPSDELDLTTSTNDDCAPEDDKATAVHDIFDSVEGDDHSDSHEEEAEEDFFAENNEAGELPEQLKDHALERLHSAMDRNVTIQDFERSQFEVYGISIQVEEDLDMTNKALYDLDVEIEKIKQRMDSKSMAYRLAESKSPGFVSKRSFRLLFLRSESFDAPAAARKIMAFFDIKLELWGESKLTKEITMADFDSTEHAGALATLENGHVQLLPARDHAGRSIVFNNLNQLHYNDDGMDQLRVGWFVIMMALEDEETQKNGLVFVQYKVGEQKGVRPNRNLLWKGGNFLRGVPFKLGCIHLCFERQSLPFIRMTKLVLEYHYSHRVRVHEGSQAECLQALMTFGIPRFAIPLSSNGEITKSFHLDWLQKLRVLSRICIPGKISGGLNTNGGGVIVESDKEQAEVGDEAGDKKLQDAVTSIEGNLVTRIVVPSRKDVLFGRGKRSQLHHGNLRLNLLLEERIEEYDAGNRKVKRDVSLTVIRNIAADGGRFLKPSDDGCTWEAVKDDNLLLKKIAHDFRTIRKRLNIQKQHYSQTGPEVSSNKKRPALSTLPGSPRSSRMLPHEI